MLVPRVAAALSRRRVLAMATALLVASAALGAASAAHPGHGTMAIVGTLVTADADSVTLEALDTASGAMRRTKAGIGRDTKVRVGKEAAMLADWIGAAVVATVDYEEGPDGQPVYYATKIQITPKKTK